MRHFYALLLLITFGAFAQPVVTTPAPVQICAFPAGISRYDLNAAIPEILQGQSPDLFRFTYHTTQAAAEANAIGISPAQIIYNSTSYYVRVDEISTGLYAVVELEILLNTPPTTNMILNSPVIAEVDTDGLATFDLTVNEAAISAVLPQVTFSYFLSYADADANQNAITTVTNFQNTVSPQIIWIRMTNPDTGCRGFVPIQVSVVEAGTDAVLTFSDPTLKTKLLNLGFGQIYFYNEQQAFLDDNNDGEIQVSEAANVQALDLQALEISDIGGLEGFYNISWLNITYNNITALNMAHFPLVRNLAVEENPLLTTLELSGAVGLLNATAWNTGVLNVEISNAPILAGLFLDDTPLQSFTATDLPVFDYVSMSGCAALTDVSITQCPAYIFPGSMSQSLQLKHVDFSGDTGLSEFWPESSYTQLESVNLSGCTMFTALSLTECENLSMLDISGCGNLENLGLYAGSIPSLSIVESPRISYLAITNAVDGEFTTGALPELSQIVFNGNGATSLDLSGATAVQNVFVFDNPALENVNIKNGALEEASLAGASLAYVCADEAQVAAVQQAVGPVVQVNSFCSFVPGGDYNTLTGMVRFDGDDNGCDTSDTGISYFKFDVSEDGEFQGSAFTQESGLYNLYFGAGSFGIAPNLENPTYFEVSPPDFDFSFATEGGSTITQDFCVTAAPAAQNTHDLEVVLAPTVPARPGFSAWYRLVYHNKGNVPMSGTVTLTNFDSDVLTFQSASVTPDAVTPDVYTWNYSELQPLETRVINVEILVNGPTDTPAVNIGYELNYSAQILPDDQDVFPDDNASGLKQFVVGAFDPNNKICTEGDVVSTDMIGEYLHYIINFENVGNAPAQNVVIVDSLDVSQFDISSLRILNSSHPAQIDLTGNILKVVFPNINLDSGGHGNILLKVRSRDDLHEGDQVINRADIFFDYNFPIVTEDAVTVFQTLSSQDVNKDKSIRVFPNPANDQITIASASEIEKIEVYDVHGRLLQVSHASGREVVLKLSDYATGNYFVRVSSERGSSVQKIIKQ